jgi:hypothetical protein
MVSKKVEDAMRAIATELGGMLSHDHEGLPMLVFDRALDESERRLVEAAYLHAQGDGSQQSD